MTPRRVKRRSVMARGSNSRTSTTSRRSHHSNNRDSGGSNNNTHSRSSMRSSRRKYQQNPVTKLLDQQQQQLQQHAGHHHPQHLQQQHQLVSAKQQFGSFYHKDNPTLTASNLQSLNQEIISNSGSNNITVAAGSASGSLTKPHNNTNLYQSFRKNIAPDPIYYNTNGQAGLLLQQQSWQSSSQSPIVGSAVLTDEIGSPTVPMGHFNPTYQHSTTNLNDGEHVDELYNNRPPSVRSSYSNFHGTRPLSSYLPNTATKENVFVGLTGAQQQQQLQQQQQQQQQQSWHQQHTHHQHPPHSPSEPLPSPLPPPPPPPSTPPQNIPFAKRTASRESIRSMAFLNSGPPAYNLNYHTPPDSETTM